MTEKQPPVHSPASDTQTNATAAFFDRADAFIDLANSQLSKATHAGKVTASLTYAAARFAVSAASTGFIKGSDLLKEKQDIIAFYRQQYEQMLSDNIDDYAENFTRYSELPSKK